MQKIQIYGSGCKRCQKLYINALEAIVGKESDYTVEKITDMESIIAAGIMSTPVLAVDGKKVITGQIASVKTIQEILGLT
ncbi:MAG: TM0996/MTH895 family glutaredoxin-like protein [Bacteroidetes bacterium]|nr:TM0996/MTH895 family glutaredoxin-like protein [Bacteroidota bacterium]